MHRCQYESLRDIGEVGEDGREIADRGEEMAAEWMQGSIQLHWLSDFPTECRLVRVPSLVIYNAGCAGRRVSPYFPVSFHAAQETER